jgi:hypothetical protein
MNIFLQVLLAFYIVFIGFIGSFAVYFSLSFELDEETEFSIFTWKGVFNLAFAHEVAVYRFIKEYINKIGIAIIMVLWTAICLPINIVAFAFILLAEIIRGIVIVFLKIFEKKIAT